MRSGFESIVALVGRVLLAVIFLISAYGKLANRPGTLAYMQSHGVPGGEAALVLAMVFELGGAVLLLAGLWGRLGAALLFIFLIPTTIYIHHFWGLPPEAAAGQQVQFLKNVAIMGGLLMVVSCGPGRISLDALRNRGPAGAAVPRAPE